jgi:6,7-dimethyl-8-ribityllumazine synthase
MLKKVHSKITGKTAARFAIVASRYNAEYVDSMLKAAIARLRKAGARDIEVVRVPGAYEVPVAAARLARLGSRAGSAKAGEALGAVICLGVILRGETTHAAHIGEAVSRALMDIQVRYEVPMVHEVLLLENREQARERCLDPRHNRGVEAAQTAIEMARVMSAIR